MKDRKKPEKFWLPHGMPSDDRAFAFSSRVFPKASQIKTLYKLWHYQFQKIDHASWRTVLATNLDGVFNCTKVVIDGMITQGWGRVVNITSVIGQIGNFGQVNYAASKAGVPALTKSRSKEVAVKRITCN